MDEQKRLRKKRTAQEAGNPVKDSAIDLSKKRKTTEQSSSVPDQKESNNAEKSWEGKEEEEEDYRWNICENC